MYNSYQKRERIWECAGLRTAFSSEVYTPGGKKFKNCMVRWNERGGISFLWLISSMEICALFFLSGLVGRGQKVKQ